MCIYIIYIIYIYIYTFFKYYMHRRVYIYRYALWGKQCVFPPWHAPQRAWLPLSLGPPMGRNNQGKVKKNRNSQISYDFMMFYA